MSKRFFLLLSGSFILLACSNQTEHSSDKKAPVVNARLAMEEDASMRHESRSKQRNYAPLSSSAAMVNAGDSLHLFVRSADMRFRVKDVVDATYTIEDFATNHNGYVEYTKLESVVNEKNTYRISEDSAVEITDFTVVNELTLRVPVQNMDTLLKDIATMVEYLDYRTVKARNVSFDLLSNQLTQLRTERMQQRVGSSIEKGSGTAEDKTTAASILEQQEAAADESLIENKRLEDKMRFATLKLQLYQENETYRRQVAYVSALKEYHPGFGSRLGDAFKTGWEIIVEVVIFLSHLWFFILLGIIGYIWLRRRGKTVKSVEQKQE